MSLKKSQDLDPKSNAVLLKSILEGKVDISKDIYKEIFKDTFKVNLDVCGVTGYQIYESTNYSFKYGEFTTDPDATIMFLKMDYIQQLLRGDKIPIENGRDLNNFHYVCRKDKFLKTRTRTNEGNAQSLIAKIPFFHHIIPTFGTSRQGRPILNEPTSFAPVKEGEIAVLMKQMLNESVDVSNELYRKNFHDQTLKVNWDIAGNIAHQIFDKTSYNYEIGTHVEDADLTLVINNPEFAKRFLLKIPTNYGPQLDEDKNLFLYIKIPVIKVSFKDPDPSLYSLLKLPFFLVLLKGSADEEKKEEREDFGGYISVNLPVGDFEETVVPYKVFEHFINKASNIVLRKCPCRERWDCQNHSVDLGCMFLGDDTKNMAVSEDQGYVATKEQALEHFRKAVDDGLVPLIGRVVGEAEDGNGVNDTGHFLSACFCCECCCIGVKSRQFGIPGGMIGGDNASSRGYKIVNDLSKCVGCGLCVEACAFNVMKLVDGKATLNLETCTGCGRCVTACPNDALSIEIEDPNYIENFIDKIESLVDVEDQSLKVKN